MDIPLPNRKNLPIIVLLAYVLLSSVLTSLDGGDFDAYLHAAQKLGEGQNIYRPPFFNKDLQYYYSVFFALILIPFSMNFFITELIWSLLSYFLLYRTFLLVKQYFDFSGFSKKQYKTWLYLTIVLAVQFILYNISMVQVTIFLLWAIFESIDLLSKKQHALSGVVLGLAINIKIMPVLMLPYLLYRGHFKALFATVLTVVALLFLPALFIGNAFNLFLISEWWAVINPVNQEHMLETGIGTHSLVSLLPVYLMETTGEMDYKRNIWHLQQQQVEFIVNAVRLLIFSLSLLYLKTLPFRKETNKLKLIWEISYFVLIIPLLLPHQQKYAFIMTVPMISYIVYFFTATFKKQKTFSYWAALGAFAVGMFFYTPLYGSSVIGWFLFEITQHYRILTFSTLLLIPVSLYASPGRLQLMHAA